MENLKKTTELCNQVQNNTRLIADVTSSFQGKPIDLLTSMHLIELHAETNVLLMECNQIFREEIIRLNRIIIQLDS